MAVRKRSFSSEELEKIRRSGGRRPLTDKPKDGAAPPVRSQRHKSTPTEEGIHKNNVGVLINTSASNARKTRPTAKEKSAALKELEALLKNKKKRKKI